MNFSGDDYSRIALYSANLTTRPLNLESEHVPPKERAHDATPETLM